MEIKFNCSNAGCRRRMSVEEAVAGQSVVCPACGTEQRAPSSHDIRFNCPTAECGQHIVVDVSEAGRFVRCPGCGKPLQVPGSPAKSISTRLEAKPVSTSPKPKRSWGSFSPWKRLAIGWGVGVAMTGILFGSFYFHALANQPRHFTAMLDEVFTDGRIVDAPVANHAGNRLLYAQEQQKDVGVFLQDLSTLKRTRVRGMETTEIEGRKVFRLFGWSPDDRYFAFCAVTSATNQDNKKYQELVICDGSTGDIKFSTNLSSSISRPELGIWLTGNTLAWLDHSHVLMLYNLEADGNLGLAGKQGRVQITRMSTQDGYGLVRLSNRTVAYLDRGNLWTMDVTTALDRQLTHFTNAVLEWLDYSPETGKFLFCMKPGGANTNRYVYEWSSRGDGQPVQLTDSYSFKGQWLKRGAGFACVSTAGEKSRLQVRADDANLATNLFTDGSIRSYCLSPQGDKLFAVASVKYKSQSIWEYDIFNKTLRDVLAQDGRTTSASKIVMPVPVSTTNAAGAEIQYYYVPPAKVAAGKKYPVVLDLYPVNRYDQNAQILANAGIYYFSANRLGLNDWQIATDSETVLAIHREMLKNPNIDPERLYVMGRSFSTGSVKDIADSHPELWHGIILFSPVAFPEIPAHASHYPSLFIAVGDEDAAGLLKQCNNFWQTACNRLIPARLHVEHGAGHGFKTANYKTSYAELTAFIRSGY